MTTLEVHPSQQAIVEAIDRIARTPDGAALYVFLQRRVMWVPPSTEKGALRADHGERSFASKLIGLMAKGIHESGGRTSSGTSNSGSDNVEQPVVVPISGPVRLEPGPRGAGRRITADTRVPGYDLPDDGN
jgi:hypothetical protein